MRYAVIIERSGNTYGAYVPDLPGCVAVGGSAEEVRELIRGAVALHLEGMRADGTAIPEPTSVAEFVTVEAA